MKRLSACFVLLLGACATGPGWSEKERFIQKAQEMNMYWVDSAGVLTEARFTMKDDGSITDGFNPSIIYNLDEMINETTAYYVWDQPFPDNTSIRIYSVLFLGVVKGTQKASFGRGNFKEDYPLERPALPITNPDPANMEAWKKWYRKAFTKDNFDTALGTVIARER